MLLRTKYAVSVQIKPGILNLTFRRGQINLSIVFIFVSGRENGYFRVASVGQLSFDRRSGCWRPRRLQDGFDGALVGDIVLRS